jgi:hypothetical protein
MMKNVMAGFWVCAVTLASCYAAVTWTVGKAPAEEKGNYEGLQYKKLPPMNIPIVAEGAVQGYVIANLVFTADAKTLREISVPPEAFIQDEVFRQWDDRQCPRENQQAVRCRDRQGDLGRELQLRR